MKHRHICSLLPVALVLLLALSSCSLFDLQQDSILGTWSREYPEGVVTEGFVNWTFDDESLLTVRSYDVFAGDHSFVYFYSLEEDGTSLYIREASFCGINGGIIYDVKECTHKRLVLKLGRVESVGGGSMFDKWEKELSFVRE